MISSGFRLLPWWRWYYSLCQRARQYVERMAGNFERMFGQEKLFQRVRRLQEQARQGWTPQMETEYNEISQRSHAIRFEVCRHPWDFEYASRSWDWWWGSQGPTQLHNYAPWWTNNRESNKVASSAEKANDKLCYGVVAIHALKTVRISSSRVGSFFK